MRLAGVLSAPLGPLAKQFGVTYATLHFIAGSDRSLDPGEWAACPSLLQTRPIYHKCDETIRGLVFCSFLVLVLRQELEVRLAAEGHEFEWADVIGDLDRLQEAEVDQEGKRFLLRSAVQVRAAWFSERPGLPYHRRWVRDHRLLPRRITTPVPRRPREFANIDTTVSCFCVLAETSLSTLS